MKFSEWLGCVPQTLKADAVWTLAAYRYALFLSDLCWADVTKLVRDKRTVGLSSQLYDAVGSVGANLAEGYSRSSGRDRARFYEYSLGSARESRDWYFKARHVLGDEVANHRMGLLSEIIRLDLTMIPDQRTQQLRESQIEYGSSNPQLPNEAAVLALENIPMP